MSEASPQGIQVKNPRATLADDLIPNELRDTFNEKLRSYQKETVNFLILRYNEYMRNLDNPDIKSTQQHIKKLTGFIVGHEMGLGKTVMVLFFLRCIIKHPHPVMRPQRIVIVVQKVLIPQWKQEISRWCQAIPLYTYHGSHQQRRQKLMRAKNERVCIILTTYAMISNDGEYIMSVLKDTNPSYSSLLPSVASDSSSSTSIDSISAQPITAVTPNAIGNTETGSTDQVDQELSSSSSFLDPVSEFSWMIKKRSETPGKSAAAEAAHRLKHLSLQSPSEPKPKHNNTNEIIHPSSQMPTLPASQAQTTNSTSVQGNDSNPENLMYLAPPPSSKLPKHCIDILIMDEATAIKNTATKISRGLKSIDAGFKLALTGTPVINNLGELWAIADYINPGYFGNRTQFDKNIAKPINTGELQDATARERFIAQKVRRALKAKLYPILIRRTTADLGSLDVNKITITFWIPLNEVQFILYGSALRAKAFQEIYCNSSNYTKMIYLLHLLRKVCDNPCELSTEDAGFFKGNLEKAILNIKQKATQPQARDGDYLQILEDLQISKASDQDLPQQDPPRLARSGSANDTDIPLINGQPTLSHDMEHVKRTGEMDAVDTPERAGLNEEDSSDNEQDAQEWALARSFDEYIHKSPDHYDLTVRSITALSSKYSLFMELITHIKNNNHRALIFCDYQIIFSMLEHLLSHNDIPYLRLDGTIADVSERDRICKNFNANKRYTALLISIKLGSMGLNLTGANRVILFAPAWSLQVEEQAIARAYRMGQKHNVVVYKLACINTLEEKMVVRQLQKAGIANVTLDDEKHRSVIKKTDLGNLFEFSPSKRLEGQLPENIKHHATSEHVRWTIQQALGSSRCGDEQTEADKELEFVNSLITRDFCIDVSVLDYLHSKANIDKEMDISEQASSQLGASDFDRILSVGLEASSKPEEHNSGGENHANLVFIYIESHRTNYFRSIMVAIFNYCKVRSSNLDDALNAYSKRLRDSIYTMKKNSNHTRTYIPRPFVPFVNPKNLAHVAEWQCYLAWAVLRASIHTADAEAFPPELQDFKITSRERLAFAISNPKIQELYAYFNFQLNSIISHFTIEIKGSLIAEMPDICEICSTSTVEEYAIYLHNLVVSRLKLLMSNKSIFRPTPTYPATLNIICSLCQTNSISLATLIAAYDNSQNWINSRFKQAPQIEKEKKKIPLLWGPMANEFEKVQKSTLTKLLQKMYGHINYAILDTCLLDPKPLDPAGQATTNTISLSDITTCFEDEIVIMQANDIFSKILSQYRLMSNEVRAVILQDTYQKLCHYQTLLPDNAKHIAPTQFTNLIAVSAPNAPQHIYEPESNVSVREQLQTEAQPSGSNAKGYEDEESIDILA
ncbi:Helicase superfamily, c-terminal domain protein [Giardia duodenalis]|uniref:Helicase superfamily, c-terminal domain protein n=1 Tax=Giardia intestinalis TaxID=5741 RepID=V6TAN6_GIAIN|nr:Helicase superfamily, c-terminal domain protein [Giardia intestinalis]